MSAQQHLPVLLNEALEAMKIKANGTYIDCTFGRGGHSQAFLSQLAAQGQLIVLDQDPSAIKIAEEKFSTDKRVKIIHESFANLSMLSERKKLKEKVDGIFFDLGVSSPQLDNAERGFSFNHDGPLDMRMNTSQGITAAEWLNKITVSELAEVLRGYGEERYAKKIASKILYVQKEHAITRTKQLSNIVEACYPKNYQGIHPATRTFQAIRIAVNDELSALQNALSAAFELLAINGRLVVISFHSLEDRIVKRFIRQTRSANYLPKLPVKHVPEVHLSEVEKMVRPSELEVEANPRSRSARMRTAEKVMQ